MAWKLAPGVGYCRAGDQLLFLDLKRDRYFALRDDDRLAFEALDGPAAEASDAAARFEASGLVQAGEPGDRLRPAFADVAHRDIHMLAAARPSVSGVLRTTESLLWARRAAASAHVAHTVDVIARRKAEIGAGGVLADATSTALRFEACRAFAPVARRCLIDSLALMRISLARGIAPTLVFGVRTAPFAAHCWLQHDGRILTCPADDALGFTPILVV